VRPRLHVAAAMPYAAASSGGVFYAAAARVPLFRNTDFDLIALFKAITPSVTAKTACRLQ